MPSTSRLAAVGFEVNRFRVQECFVAPVEFQVLVAEPGLLLAVGREEI